jgi:hypothetical protein
MGDIGPAVLTAAAAAAATAFVKPQEAWLLTQEPRLPQALLSKLAAAVRSDAA